MTVQKIFGGVDIFHLISGNFAQVFEHFFEHRVLDKAVNTIKGRFFSADCHSFYQHIEAFIYTKLLIDRRQAVLIFPVKIVHIVKPMCPFQNVSHGYF